MDPSYAQRINKTRRTLIEHAKKKKRENQRINKTQYIDDGVKQRQELPKVFDSSKGEFKLAISNLSPIKNT